MGDPGGIKKSQLSQQRPPIHTIVPQKKEVNVPTTSPNFTEDFKGDYI